MKRLLVLASVLAAATLMNGCSKCSREAPVEPPPVVEPVPTAPATDDQAAPPETLPTDSAPADSTAQPPANGTAPAGK